MLQKWLLNHLSFQFCCYYHTSAFYYVLLGYKLAPSLLLSLLWFLSSSQTSYMPLPEWPLNKAQLSPDPTFKPSLVPHFLQDGIQTPWHGSLFPHCQHTPYPPIPTYLSSFTTFFLLWMAVLLNCAKFPQHTLNFLLISLNVIFTYWNSTPSIPSPVTNQL